jgi:hypothetical protein
MLQHVDSLYHFFHHSCYCQLLKIVQAHFFILLLYFLDDMLFYTSLIFNQVWVIFSDPDFINFWLILVYNNIVCFISYS